MAVSALGIQLLLQAGSAQVQDLVNSLQPGDSIKGRIVELLPQDKAVINLRGLADSAFANARFAVEVHTRDGILSSALAQEVGGSKRFRVEVR